MRARSSSRHGFLRLRSRAGPAGRRALALAGCLAAGVAPAWPQSVQTVSGLPVQVIPYAQEVGSPPIADMAGTVNIFAPADNASSTDMSSTGSGAVPGGSPGGGGATGMPGSGGSGSTAGNGDSTGTAAASWSQYNGQAVGTGQCVALVQAADPSVGLTRTWVQGAQVQGDTGLVPGTAIATFDANGQYANATDGSSHAAIYLGQNDQGIQVMDQWAGHDASYRTIRWNNTSGLAADTGSAFHVVSH